MNHPGNGGGTPPNRRVAGTMATTPRAVLTELIPETDEDRRLFRVMDAGPLRFAW